MSSIRYLLSSPRSYLFTDSNNTRNHLAFRPIIPHSKVSFQVKRTRARHFFLLWGKANARQLFTEEIIDDAASLIFQTFFFSKRYSKGEYEDRLRDVRLLICACNMNLPVSKGSKQPYEVIIYTAHIEHSQLQTTVLGTRTADIPSQLTYLPSKPALSSKYRYLVPRESQDTDNTVDRLVPKWLSYSS